MNSFIYFLGVIFWTSFRTSNSRVHILNRLEWAVLWLFKKRKIIRKCCKSIKSNFISITLIRKLLTILFLKNKNRCTWFKIGRKTHSAVEFIKDSEAIYFLTCLPKAFQISWKLKFHRKIGIKKISKFLSFSGGDSGGKNPALEPLHNSVVG